MSPYVDLLIAIAGGITSTIGVCVYLIREQQNERVRSDERADARVDQMIDFLNAWVTRQESAQSEMSEVLGELAKSMNHLAERISALEGSHR